MLSCAVSLGDTENRTGGAISGPLPFFFFFLFVHFFYLLSMHNFVPFHGLTSFQRRHTRFWIWSRRGEGLSRRTDDKKRLSSVVVGHKDRRLPIDCDLGLGIAKTTANRKCPPRLRQSRSGLRAMTASADEPEARLGGQPWRRSVPPRISWHAKRVFSLGVVSPVAPPRQGSPPRPANGCSRLVGL